MTKGLVKVAGSVFAKDTERSIPSKLECDYLASERALEPVMLPGKNRNSSTTRPVVAKHSIESGGESF